MCPLLPPSPPSFRLQYLKESARPNKKVVAGKLVPCSDDDDSCMSDALGDCEKYSGEDGPYPEKDDTYLACMAAIRDCVAEGDNEVSNNIMDPNCCYCPPLEASIAGPACEEDSDCEGGLMCKTPKVSVGLRGGGASR